MPMYNRGGRVEKTGNVGRVLCLRQQMLLPGERLDARVNGEVRLTPMRERQTVPVFARLDGFMTPLRWLWDDFPDWIKEGPGTTKNPPTKRYAATPDSPTVLGLDGLGIGGAGGPVTVYKWFEDALLRIYNEWYKWPEDSDITAWPADGGKAVALPAAWTRLQQYNGIMGADTELTTTQDSSREKFDVRDLAELQARFRNAVERDWIGHGRYVDLLRELWNAQGSREVDKVPVRLRGIEAGVDPRTLWATDSGGLGTVTSIYDFEVNHRFGRIVAPEHCIVTYMWTLRFAPVAEDEVYPLAVPGGRTYASLVGDPGMLAAARPERVQQRHLATIEGTTEMGYLPAGWQYRAGYNSIGARVDVRNTFPLVQTLQGASTPTLYRDSTRINDAFVNTTLGHYFVNLRFNEMVDSPIPGPKSSLYAGTGMAGRGSAYPYPGPTRVI